MNEIVQYSTGQIQLRLRNAAVVLRITRAFAAFDALVNGRLCLLDLECVVGVEGICWVQEAESCIVLLSLSQTLLQSCS